MAEKASKKEKLDNLFKGKKFEIREEVNLNEPVATPLGYKIKHGYRIVQVDKLTRDYVEYYVSKSLLDTIADEYGAVEKPESKRRGRPKKEPIEQAEEWANRDIPNDAQQITQPGPTYPNPNADQSF